MKKFTLFLFCLVSISAFSQGIVRLTPEMPKGYNPFYNDVTPESFKPTHHSSFKANYDTVKIDAWYDIINSIYKMNNVKFSRFTPMMTHDSTMVYFSLDSNNNVQKNTASWFALGHCFDLSDSVWDNDNIDETYVVPDASKNDYTIDSVYLTGYYGRSTDSTVIDTLVITCTKKIDYFTWTQTKAGFGVVDYDKNNDISKSDTTIKLLLDQTDTSMSKSRGFVARVNRKLKLPENYAFAYEFRSGVKVNSGDSVLGYIDTAQANKAKINISKKINQFIGNVYVDNSSYADFGINNGLVLPLFQKRLNKWYYSGATAQAPKFIPGNAYARPFYPYMLFKVNATYLINGIDEPKSIVGSSTIYPNPVNSDYATLSFTLFNNQNVTVEVSNLLGQKLFTAANSNFAAGKNKVQINTSGLSNGVYFYTVKAGNYTTTNKFTVSR